MWRWPGDLSNIGTEGCSVQYIINPAGNRAIPNSLASGINVVFFV
jgi:hypothetical protein